jgi:hypothetical protein
MLLLLLLLFLFAACSAALFAAGVKKIDFLCQDSNP